MVLRLCSSEEDRMTRLTVGLAIAGALIAAPAAAQEKRPPGTKGVTHEITVTADTVYTGTMQMTIQKGTVTGTMKITMPTEITGTVAGTAKDGVLHLEFPFQMTERKCTGTVKMRITMPAKSGPAAGTMEASGCGDDPSEKTTGTVEIKPVDPPKGA
jgi:hypothetical protein